MVDKTYENIVIEREGAVTFLMVNRPDKRNAMSPALHYEMEDALAGSPATNRPVCWCSAARANPGAPVRTSSCISAKLPAIRKSGAAPTPPAIAGAGNC